MRFYCQCLNVTIDVLEACADQESLTHVIPTDLLQWINTSEEWLVCTERSIPTVHVAWQSLFQTIPIRDMKLNRCLACQVYTHISNVQSNKILINKDLLEEKAMKTAYLDPNYSEITKIILPMVVNESIITRAPGSHDDAVPRDRAVVQQLYRQALEDAERDTEDKIRTFQHEQEQHLKAKTSAISKELDTFLGLVRSMPRHTSSSKASPTLQTSSSYINENSMESGFGSDIFESSGTDLSRQSSTVERTLSERAAAANDDDDEPNDDSMPDNHAWTSNSVFTYATSLPKEISYRPRSSFAIAQQVDEDETDSLERIGKSFRELSQSLMCTDGTELFGELPSPRLNARAT